MRKIDAYDRLNNDTYEAPDAWWNGDGVNSLLLASLNPARLGFARRALAKQGVAGRGSRALDVGCGGGILSEELARLGFATVGIDPSRPSLEAARAHARAGGLTIEYVEGAAESLPFPAQSFEAVFCCDVLEHLRDPAPAVAEAARVLSPGGVFVYETINRTAVARLALIGIAQTSKRWAFMPPNLHVRELFIKPREMKAMLRKNGFLWKEHRGLMPAVGIPRGLALLARRKRDELSYGELGKLVQFRESAITVASYIGYAVKAKER